MIFLTINFEQKIPLSNTSKKNHSIILVKLFLTWPIWLVVFFTSWVVDYFTGQISQQKFWATNFLVNFFYLKNAYPKFLIKFR
jgi:hypothetical protein